MRLHHAIIAACLFAPAAAALADDKPIEIKLVDQFNAMFGAHPGFRANHAKGAVFEGTFTPSRLAATITTAAHLQSTPVPVTVRFSNSGGLPDAPDTHPSAGTRGLAVKFHLPDGSETDIVCISLPGFPVATGEEFLALLQAVAATEPNSPKPTPLETFLGSHPAAAKLLSAPVRIPTSYATVPFYGVNAFKFTNAKGEIRYGRYRIVPEAGEAYLTAEQAAAKSHDFLADDVRDRLTKVTVRFRILVQLADPSDPTADATKIWPDNRPTVELGELSITRPDPDSASAQKALLFLPTNLTAGIDPSDDPLLQVRTGAYFESWRERRAR